MTKRILAKVLGIFFRLLYHQFAWTYDFVASFVSLGLWKDWVMTTLPHLNGPRVLELGFGPGHLQSALTSRGVSAFGVDASPQMAKLTRRRFQRENNAYRLINAYAQRLPFADESFKQVVATFPPEFIVANDTLAEVRRVLKSNGSMVVLPNAWITGKNFFQKFASWLFGVTDQAPPWNDCFLDYFIKAGFHPQVKRVTRKSWTLVIILAKK